MPRSIPDKNWAFCMDLVRDQDPDRYLATLLAPVRYRPALHALHAFNCEVARVRETVREPLPGEVRYQWWRDVLMNTARGDVQSHPVASALLHAVETCHLPVKALLDIIDARTFDLYDDPMPTLHDLEGYCGETASLLFQLACFVLNDGREPQSADAAGHTGVAYALTGLMRALPYHAGRGQIYLPADLMAQHHARAEDVFSGTMTPQVSAVLAALRGHARAHLAKARLAIAALPPALKPAFLSLSLVEPYLDAMERADYDPFRQRIDIPQWRRQWILWRNS